MWAIEPSKSLCECVFVSFFSLNSLMPATHILHWHSQIIPICYTCLSLYNLELCSCSSLFLNALLPSSLFPILGLPNQYSINSRQYCVILSPPGKNWLYLWTTTMQQCRFYFGICETLSNWYLTNLSPHLKHDYSLPCC